MVRASCWLAGLSAFALASGTAFAQTTPAAQPVAASDTPSDAINAIGDIVVTAQRKSERLQNVGIAVSAYGGEALRAQGITTSTEIARLTPGVNISGTLGGQGIQFSIRGVTQTDFNDAIEAPIAIYVDDTYIASQQAQGMALFDLDRVEALKGPQGTLFGRNATGGLVHFIVKKPELGHTAGYLEATYGRFDTTVLEGALNLPIGENAAFRFSGTWNRHGSVWNNVDPAGVLAGAPLVFGPQGVSPRGEDLGKEDSLAGRAQLLWKPLDTLTVRLTGSALRQNLSESPWTSSAVAPVIDAQNRVVGSERVSANDTRAAIGPTGANYYNPAVLAFQGFLFSPNNNGQRAPGASWFGYVPVDIGKRQLSKDFALSNLNTFRAYNGALHLDAELGAVSLASVTSYSRYKKNFLLDADASPVDALAFGTKADTDTFSQELRISGGDASFTWTAGLYYLDIDAQVANGLLAPKGSALAAVFGLAAQGVDPLSVFRLKTKSGSMFGQFSWEFAPKLTLVAGGRLIREHQNYVFVSNAYANVNDYTIDTDTALFPLLPSFADKRTNTLWAGKAQVEYRPNRGLLLYGGINRGVKGGSYNGPSFDGSPPLPASAIPYKPENLLSFEGGFKLTGPASRYTLNASVFHYIYNNYQSFSFVGITGSVSNQKARTTGAEIEATTRVGNSLTLGVSGAYVDATVKGFAIAPGVVRDVKPTYTPKYSGSARATYTVPTRIADGELSAGAVLTYQSSFYHNARNFDADRFAGRTLLDLNIHWESLNGLSLGAYLKNVFDKRYNTVGLDLGVACGCNLEAYGLPRTWGVTVGYKF